MKPPAVRRHGIAISACPCWLGEDASGVNFVRALQCGLADLFCLQEHRYTRCRVLCMGRRVFGCWAVCLVHRLQNGFVPLGTSGPMVVSCSCAGFLVIQEGACWDSTGNQQNQVLLPSGSSSQQGPPQTHAPTPYLRQYKMEQVSWADQYLAWATRHMVFRVAAWPVSV